MTVSDLLTKAKIYWYILLILPLVMAYFGFSSFINKTSYTASISLGISYNNIEYTKVNTENWDRQINVASEYLANRFKSIEVQKNLSEQMGYGDNMVNAKKPFYEISNQTAGFVSVSGNFETKTDATQFLEATKKTYQNILETEKGNNELINYKIQPMNRFLEAIVEVKTPVQFRILPTVFGLLLAVLIVCILPLKK